MDGEESLHQAFDRLVAAQATVVEIINDLLRSPRIALDASIQQALARTGQLAQADRTYVFRLREGGRIDNTHEWVADGIEPMIDHLQNLPASQMNEWMPDFAQDRAVTIHDVGSLAEESAVKEVLSMQGIRSLLAVPMMNNGSVTGFVGYDAVRAHRVFLESETTLIRSVANVIGVVLERRDAENEAEAAGNRLRHERNRLQATLAAIPDLILELDERGQFTGYHAGTHHDLAFPPELFLNRTSEEIFPPELADLARRAMREVDRDGISTNVEYALTMNGEERWYHLSAAARKGENHGNGYVFAIRDTTEIRRQQSLLRRLSEVAKRTSNLVVVTDRHDRIEWVNPAFEARSGWKQDEVVGRRPGELLAAGTHDAADRARIREAVNAGLPVKAELQNRSRNGTLYWISADIQPLKDRRKQLDGFIAVQTDITEQIETSKKLLKSANDANLARQRLTAAVEALDQGFAIFDSKDQLVLFNRPFVEFFGFSVSNIGTGTTFRDILQYRLKRGVYPVGVGSEAPWIAERLALKQQEPIYFEDQLCDGRWLRTVNVATSDGGRVVLETDITQIKEDQRRAIRDRALAMEASQDGIAITDANGRYIYMNEAHRRMFGISVGEDVTEMSWKNLYNPSMVTWIEENIIPDLIQHRRWLGALQGVSRDGRPIEQEVSLTLNDDGGIICIARDNTEQNRLNRDRARLRDELQISLREGAISHIVSDLAHEFNNIWSIAMGSLSLLSEKLESEGPIHKDIARIEKSLRAAADLFKGARQSSGDADRFTYCDLRNIIYEAEQMLTFRLSPDQIVRTSTAHSPPAFYADRSAIMQVVLNLTTNARDAIGDMPATISLEAQSADAFFPEREPDVGTFHNNRKYALIRVSDSGSGVPSTIRGQIFQRNFTTKGKRGSGLGLAIVAGLLRRHGGSMWFDSEPCQGTVVTVLWPKDNKELQQTAVAGRGSELADHHFLVVDDAYEVAKILADMLESGGASATILTDPREAIEAVREAPDRWDAIVTDFDMPAMTGVELARHLRKIVPRLRIVAVSAMAETIGIDADIFDRVLCKPVTKPILTEQLLECINARTADRNA